MASSPIAGIDTIVDSHHHFWDLSKLDYAWMPAGESVIKRTYLPADLRPVLRQNDVSKTVVVQAHQSLDETEFLLDIARDTDFVAGVVAWVDLQSPNVGVDLDRLMRRPKLVGVRHQVEDDPDDDWLVRSETVRGLRMLAERGLAYDVLARPRHLSRVPDLAERVPDLRMVIDHIAKPLIKDGVMGPWASDIAAVAEIPGVHCKVSGMVTEADHETWTLADLIPYVAHVVDVFGYDRLMFGSDWPVCLLASGYDRVLDAALEAVAPATPANRAAFLGRNAIRFYGLDA
ncbi:MAG: hypothetical protein FI707_14915 [SAR202 cluster bacterium]|nr:hypothetical protein [Chloroflexota bacterium]MDP6663299.1 amidohydrolase family protein [SAR202 cluster bacterium]MQG70067.1 hypothetical protein [SAR202 cluster bacterium]|tara:strand:+ start:4774 stop:5637 length:864 start_codon:yes stop_codon:yes gene_type:complete